MCKRLEDHLIQKKYQLLKLLRNKLHSIYLVYTKNINYVKNFGRNLYYIKLWVPTYIKYIDIVHIWRYY